MRPLSSVYQRNPSVLGQDIGYFWMVLMLRINYSLNKDAIRRNKETAQISLNSSLPSASEATRGYRKDTHVHTGKSISKSDLLIIRTGSLSRYVISPVAFGHVSLWL